MNCQDVKEILEPEIKEKKYFKLKFSTLIKILPKYVKIKISGKNEVKRGDIDIILNKLRT